MAESFSREKLRHAPQKEGKKVDEKSCVTTPAGNNCCCCCCLHIKNRSDLYPVPFSFLLFKAKKRISVVTR